jgi:anti-sigma B factor antagonist
VPTHYAHFKVEVVDKTHVLHLRNHQLIEQQVITHLKEELLRYVGHQSPKLLVISFKEVQRFSSENFGVLLNVNNLVKANKGELRLCEISDQIREVFGITRLDQLFEIHGSLSGAIDQFK